MNGQICRLCLQTVSSNNCQTIGESLLKTLKLNLNNTEELLACESCLEALKGVLGVILKCLEVEEKIREYIELEGRDDKGEIQLKEVRKLMLKPKVKLENESVGIGDTDGICDHIKEEITAMAEFEIKHVKEICHPELIIKTDDDIKSEQSDCDMTDNKLEKSDSDGLQETFTGYQTPEELFRIPVVTSETRKRKKRSKQHLWPLKISSDTKTFHCETCAYDTKNKNFWRKHLLTHKSRAELKMFKCELCSYEAKQKGHLKSHLLTHRSPAELKMFKYELCSYETKYKGQVKMHLLTHKSPSELKMFQCELCPHKTKHKNAHKMHLLTHKSPSEIAMFKCAFCSYEARQKNYLKKHLLTHKSPSELKMFKCELCPYEAKVKDYLERHSLTHKSPTELKMFKCESCSYEAKQRSSLKIHLLTHKSPSELKMFECELCPYESKSI